MRRWGPPRRDARRGEPPCDHPEPIAALPLSPTGLSPFPPICNLLGARLGPRLCGVVAPKRLCCQGCGPGTMVLSSKLCARERGVSTFSSDAKMLICERERRKRGLEARLPVRAFRVIFISVFEPY